MSSKLPCMPATVIAASLPITWAHTCSTASGITGLTLPGMIDEPFCSSGSTISPRPARGPLDIQRRSLQIFVSGHRDDLQRAGRRDERVARGLRREVIERRGDQRGHPGRRRLAELAPGDRRRTRGCVFSPLPTAVPPSGIRPSSASVAPTCVRGRGRPAPRTRRTPGRASPGTASIRCVRPDFTTSANSTAFAASAAAQRGRAPAARSSCAACSAARWTADGNTSFELWPRLTWSFGWARPSVSAADHLVGVHVRRRARAGLEHVDRELGVVLAGGDRVAGGGDRRPRASASSRPSSAFAAGGRRLDPAEPVDDRAGIGSPEMWKFSTAFDVSVPHSIPPLFHGTRTRSTRRVRIVDSFPEKAQPMNDTLRRIPATHVRPGGHIAPRPDDRTESESILDEPGR